MLPSRGLMPSHQEIRDRRERVLTLNTCRYKESLHITYCILYIELQIDGFDLINREYLVHKYRVHLQLRAGNNLVAFARPANPSWARGM